MQKTYGEINDRLKKGEAVVLTANEFKKLAADEGIKAAAKKADVVTTGTFGAMCSSGLFLNFGHSDPPIKMSKVWLNGVPAYTGIAAVDAYIGATEEREGTNGCYGGAHVIEDLVSGKKVHLRATGKMTDCYPLAGIETDIDIDSINECTLFNPRNAYQNYAAAANSTDSVKHTYMGALLPNLGNVTYSTAGEVSPLLNDPHLRTIGIGTRIFLGGGEGYVAWHGTQNNPARARADNGVPVGAAATLSLIGDLKKMDKRYLRAAVFRNYGVSLFVGIGVPIPVVDEEIARSLAVRNEDITTTIYDYGIPARSRPAIRTVSYRDLRSGKVTIRGKQVPTSPLSSLYMANLIMNELKGWLQYGSFRLTEKVASLPSGTTVRPLEAAPVNASARENAKSTKKQGGATK